MNRIEINGRLIDLDSGVVRGDDAESQLSPRLQTLLNFLVQRPDRVLSRDEIIEAVWGHLQAATDDSVNAWSRRCAVRSLEPDTHCRGKSYADEGCFPIPCQSGGR